MDSIIINPKDEKEMKFITELLKKLGVKNKVLSKGVKGKLNSQELTDLLFMDEIPETYFEMLDQQREDYIRGESNSKSWDEVKKNLRRKTK